MTQPLSVYVHLPYCAKRCPYCDFNTYVVQRIPEDRYAAALAREAEFAARDTAADRARVASPAGPGPWAGRAVETVFFGGGTPSMFSPSTVGGLLETFDRLWGFSADAEITLEANPGSLEGGGEERLRGFRAAGINRISFGAQSFNARHLATLGRIHSASETTDAFDAARRAGFDNVSCDLIYGIPGQTVDDWERDIRAAIDLGSEHVSAYCLTYEKGTPMTGMRDAGLVAAADEDTELAMFRLARERFSEAGLRQYEISNYARRGRESRHNLAYWTWRDYLGLGAGAHGFAGTRSPDGASWGRRYANKKLPELYMQAAEGAWHATEEALSLEMAVAEYLMVSLRLADGIDEAHFEELFDHSLTEAAPRLESFIRDGLLTRNNGSVSLTDRGLEIADSVITTLAAG